MNLNLNFFKATWLCLPEGVKSPTGILIRAQALFSAQSDYLKGIIPMRFGSNG
jgi:hypothetical protein